MTSAASAPRVLVAVEWEGTESLVNIERQNGEASEKEIEGLAVAV